MFDRFKREIVNYFYRKSRLWGVDYEGEFKDSKKPPEFVITKHARERMNERLNGKQKEKERLVIAAWFSEESIERVMPEFTNGKKIKRHYRKYDGMIWVFAKEYIHFYKMTQHTLITVYYDNI